MKKILIGLTPSHNTENGDITMRPTYMGAIAAAGAIPLILPLESTKEDLQQLVDMMDGFLFTGGPDVHPFFFGEDTHANCGAVDMKRDKLEMALLPLVMKARKPILGICRGIQSINICLGGTIYQDIPSQFHEEFPIAHKQPYHYSIPSHIVNVVPGTRFAGICNNQPVLRVNSMHHQAIRDLAPGLIISATASGSLIEAAEMPDYPFLVAVQWHPEYLWQDDPAAANLFKQFVDACAH